jgi:hypothetical protein
MMVIREKMAFIATIETLQKTLRFLARGGFILGKSRNLVLPRDGRLRPRGRALD